MPLPSPGSTDVCHCAQLCSFQAETVAFLCVGKLGKSPSFLLPLPHGEKESLLFSTSKRKCLSSRVIAAPPPVLWDGLQNHTFRHTVFCQDGNPSMGLSESYDEDQLFSYDFSQNTRVPRLPDFAAWAQGQGDASAISFDKDFCQALVQQVGPKLEGVIPVSRGQERGVGLWGGRRCGLTPQMSPFLRPSSFTPPGSAPGFSLLLRHFSPWATLYSWTLSAGGSRRSKVLKIHRIDEATEASWPH